MDMMECLSLKCQLTTVKQKPLKSEETVCTTVSVHLEIHLILLALHDEIWVRIIHTNFYMRSQKYFYKRNVVFLCAVGGTLGSRRMERLGCFCLCVNGKNTSWEHV